MHAHDDLPVPAIEVESFEHGDVLAADEPRTPMWLPLVGSLLFLISIVLFVALRPPGKTAQQLSREAEVAAQKRAAAQKPPEPPPAPAPQPMAPGGEAAAPRKGG